jgi:hypothetical protein
MSSILVRRHALVRIGSVLLMAMPVSLLAADRLFPDVLQAKVRESGPGSFDFDVTVSSPYDSPSRYADGFRVLDKSGRVLGERKLLHDHQTEQPFTRDLYAVRIPASVKVVVIQARDQLNGYGGRSVEMSLPGR